MATPLNSLLKTAIETRIVDVGASPIDGKPIYTPLLEQGHSTVVGFEPDPAALARLKEKKGAHETYLPYAIGDGLAHTLHICAAPGMTSLLRPNPRLLDLLHHFSRWAEVLRTEEITTRRLDDVPEAAGFDFLKLDIQGAELMVLQNATAGLRHAVCVQAEVEFLPLYIDQPLFSDVEQFMRAQGFVVHRFTEMVSRALKPVLINNNVMSGLSQVLWTDAIFIRDFTRLELMTNEQLLRLSRILNDCYRSIDIVLHLLNEHDRRAGTDYAAIYKARGLQP